MHRLLHGTLDRLITIHDLERETDNLELKRGGKENIVDELQLTERNWVLYQSGRGRQPTRGIVSRPGGMCGRRAF